MPILAAAPIQQPSQSVVMPGGQLQHGLHFGHRNPFLPPTVKSIRRDLRSRQDARHQRRTPPPLAFILPPRQRESPLDVAKPDLLLQLRHRQVGQVRQIERDCILVRQLHGRRVHFRTQQLFLGSRRRGLRVINLADLLLDRVEPLPVRAGMFVRTAIQRAGSGVHQPVIVDPHRRNHGVDRIIGVVPRRIGNARRPRPYATGMPPEGIIDTVIRGIGNAGAAVRVAQREFQKLEVVKLEFVQRRLAIGPACERLRHGRAEVDAQNPIGHGRRVQLENPRVDPVLDRWLNRLRGWPVRTSRIARVGPVRLRDPTLRQLVEKGSQRLPLRIRHNASVARPLRFRIGVKPAQQVAQQQRPIVRGAQLLAFTFHGRLRRRPVRPPP